MVHNSLQHLNITVDASRPMSVRWMANLLRGEPADVFNRWRNDIFLFWREQTLVYRAGDPAAATASVTLPIDDRVKAWLRSLTMSGSRPAAMAPAACCCAAAMQQRRHRVVQVDCR